MLILFIVLALICLYKIRFANFHNDYLGREQTDSIKGIFAIIIVFSHMRNYIVLEDTFLNNSYVFLLNIIGQLMVVLFFFYSGYGIMQSYCRKDNYSKGFFKNRVLKTLVHFDIAVLLYLVLSLILGVKYNWREYAFCWIGLESIGNSNWFIFVIVALYVITFLAFPIVEKFFSKTKTLSLAIFVTFFSLILYVALYALGKQSWWYNTLLCFPLGMWYSILKNRIDDLLQKNKVYNYMFLFGFALLFCCVYILQRKFDVLSIVYSILSCLFCLLVTIITTKIKFDNFILRWLGKYSFSIYILQRIPMIVVSNFIPNINAYIFAIVVILLSLILSFVFGFIYNYVDVKLLKKEKTRL